MTNIQYKCNKCNKTFNHKNDYNKHLKRKKPCNSKIINGKVDESTDIFEKKIPQNDFERGKNINGYLECRGCGKSYSRRDNFNRHIMQFCKAQKVEEVLEDIQTKTQDKQSSDNLPSSKYSTKHDSTNSKYESVKIPVDSPQHPANSIKIKKEYKCNYCNFIFTRSDSLNIHLNSRCKVKKEKDDQKDEIFQKLLKELDQQKEKINKLEKIILENNIQTINNNNNTTNNINNTQNITQLNNIKLGFKNYYNSQG